MSIIISVPGNAWVDLHAATGLAPDTPLQISNQSAYSLRLHQGAMAPTLDVSGELLDAFPGALSVATVTGAGSCWAKCGSGTSLAANVSVQEVL